MDDLILNENNIQNMIFTFKDKQVMIDRDLATLYQVETKVLNQAIKRNIERFPADFRFQLTNEEKNELVTKCDRFKILKHSSSNPYAFTEQGVSMLSAVLKSKIAVDISIKIIHAFVDMRKFILYNNLQIEISKKYHDRFLIVNNTTYHIGTSLKDLGKKVFAFSKMDIDILNLGMNDER